MEPTNTANNSHTDTITTSPAEPADGEASPINIPITDAAPSVEAEPATDAKSEPVAIEPGLAPAPAKENADSAINPAVAEAETDQPAPVKTAPANSDPVVPQAELKPQLDTDHTKHSKHPAQQTTDEHKLATPQKPRAPGVTTAIVATVIIVFGLAALAVYAYLKTNK
jgi:hypothetical protein